MMQIKASELKKFLYKVNMDRTIEEPVFQVEDDRIVALNADPTDIFFNKVVLSKKAFKSYEKVDNFGLFNLSRFIDLINSYGEEEISIEFTENLIKIAGKNREAEFVVPDLEIFKDKLELKEPEIPTNIEVTIPRDSLVKISSAINILGAKFVSFNTDANILICEVGDQDKIREKLATKTTMENAKVNVTKDVSNITSVLSGDATLLIGTGLPLHIKEKDKNIEADYFIAPLLDEEIQEQKAENEKEKNKK